MKMQLKINFQVIALKKMFLTKELKTLPKELFGQEMMKHIMLEYGKKKA